MKCSNCGRNILDTWKKCPYCNAPIVINENNLNNTNNINETNINLNNINNSSSTNVNNNINNLNNVKIDNDIINKKEIFENDKFFLIVIIVGLIVLAIIILINLNFYGNKRKHSTNIDETTSKFTTTTKVNNSKNKGIENNFTKPSKAGTIVIGSLKDYENSKVNYVDVTISKWLSDDEVNDLVLKNASDVLLPSNVEWKGFIYKVTLNDLDYLGENEINPKLNVSYYLSKDNRRDFILVNNDNYILRTMNIYDNHKVKNGTSTEIYVLFQNVVGNNDYVICLGNSSEKSACFSKL